MALRCLQPHARGVRLAVQAVPRASRTEVVDFPEDRCRIKVKAPPVEGEANAALIAFLAKLFGLPKKQVLLEQGAHGKQKVFLLVGIDPATAEGILSPFLPGAGKENG